MDELLIAHIIDWISVFGTIVTIVGFCITVKQIKSTKEQVKQTNTKVDNAINKTKYKINQMQYIKDITLLIKDLDVIIDFLNEKKTEIAFYLMRDKHAQLYKIYNTKQYDDCMNKSNLKSLIDQYVTIQDDISNIKKENLEKTINYSSLLLNQIKNELIATSNNIENKELWDRK